MLMFIYKMYKQVKTYHEILKEEEIKKDMMIIYKMYKQFKTHHEILKKEDIKKGYDVNLQTKVRKTYLIFTLLNIRSRICFVFIIFQGFPV